MFRMPPETRWANVKAQTRQLAIGQLIELIGNIKVGEVGGPRQRVLILLAVTRWLLPGAAGVALDGRARRWPRPCAGVRSARW